MSSKTANSIDKKTRSHVMTRSISPPMMVLMWMAFLGMIACNIGFEQLQFAGTTSRQVSAEVFSWFTPADYVFSIWPLIYLAMTAWMIAFTRDAIETHRTSSMKTQENRYPKRAHTKPGERREKHEPIKRTAQIPDRSLISNASALMFIASCALNVLWLAAWHLRMIPASVIVIALFMAMLGLLYFCTFESTDRQIYRAPISLYFAWISVATVANCMYLLTYLGLGELPALQPALTVLIAIFYLAQTALIKSSFDDMVFGLVVAWALVGIGIHIAPINIAVALTCYIIAGTCMLLSLISWDQIFLKTKSV